MLRLLEKIPLGHGERLALLVCVLAILAALAVWGVVWLGRWLRGGHRDEDDWCDGEG